MSLIRDLGRIIWEASRRDEGSISAIGADFIASSILADDYRKLEPAFQEALQNDGYHEYTTTSDCDGSNVRQWRRRPRMVAEMPPSQWEEIEQEGVATAPPVAEYQGCRSGRDGDCFWAECPQLRDNEPRATGRHCPRDTQGDDFHV